MNMRQKYMEVPPSQQNPKQQENNRDGYKNIIIYILIIIIIYTLCQKIFIELTQQSYLMNLINMNEAIIKQMQSKIIQINRTSFKLNKDDLQALENIQYQINQQYMKIYGQNNYNNIINKQKINKIQQEIQQRTNVIDLINSHNKQQFRKNKIEMFNKIGLKQSFQPQKIRNPWSFHKINMKSTFIDTLQNRHMAQQIQKQYDRLNQIYDFNRYEKQLSFCVVVPTRNNAKNYRYQYNLQSIINQIYQNYKIIIIDDASNDNTGQLIEIFLSHHLPPRQYHIIRNQQRLYAVFNINNAIRNHCKQQDIALLVNGDDQLLGRHVFKVINAVYQKKKPGFAYTNHFYGRIHQKDFQIGYSSSYTFSQITNKMYRYIGQRFGHMRTFPVKLFLLIKQDDMKAKNGSWLTTTYDQTFFMPILQMACDSIEYIDQYMYLYNYGTGQNDGQIRHSLQMSNAGYIRSRPKYNCVEEYRRFK